MRNTEITDEELLIKHLNYTFEQIRAMSKEEFTNLLNDLFNINKLSDAEFYEKMRSVNERFYNGIAVPDDDEDLRAIADDAAKIAINAKLKRIIIFCRTERCVKCYD